MDLQGFGVDLYGDRPGKRGSDEFSWIFVRFRQIWSFEQQRAALINQSINQTTLINQPTNQSINQSIHQSIISQPLNQSRCRISQSIIV